MRQTKALIRQALIHKEAAVGGATLAVRTHSQNYRQAGSSLPGIIDRGLDTQDLIAQWAITICPSRCIPSGVLRMLPPQIVLL